MSILINILLVFHVLVSLLIILSVLMQRPKNEGLGAAFGGGMTDNLFGAQTTNVLQSFTRWLGGIFFGLTLLLSFLYVRQTSATSDVQRRLAIPTTPPAAPPAPANLPLEETAPQPLPAAPEGASAPVKPDGSPAETAPTPGAPAPIPTDPANPPPAPAPAEPANSTPAPTNPPAAADPAKPAPAPANPPAEAPASPNPAPPEPPK